MDINEGNVKLKQKYCENKEGSYNFDHVFGTDSTQKAVYEATAKPLTEGLLAGYNCTCFAYGQTGSGKTHTVSRGPAETTLRLAAADVGGNSARTRFRSKRLAGMVRRAL